MYLSFIAYRHANGEPEGFVGHALSSPSAADAEAQQAIRNKLRAMNLPGNGFDPSRIIRHESVVSVAEMSLIRKDWGTYRAAGSTILPLLRKGKRDYFTG